MTPLLRDRPAWLFSLKTFAAAIAALYVALAGNLSRPYWAMATVYIVSQPLLGPTRAKGVYRVLGTLLAGVATLVLLPNLVQTPLLLSAAMALWLSACLFLALLDRGPRGYAFLLAGYTTAFIGFPAVAAPEGIFATVVARSEEIVLGTVMAVLFAALVFPASVRPMLSARIGNWMQDAAQWCRQVLQRAPAQAPRNRLAADLVQFEALIAFVRHDDPRHAAATPALEQLRARMLLLLPTLASIADRLDALHGNAGALPPALVALLEDIGDWIAGTDDQTNGNGDARHAALQARISALRPTQDQDIAALLLTSLLLRLQELLTLWHDCRGLQQAWQQGNPPAGPTLQDAASADAPERRPQRSWWPWRRAIAQATAADAAANTRHIDYGMAAFSALSAGAALMVYCVLWIGIGWEGGGNGAMMAAVTAAFFAAQDDPAPSMLGFLLWALVASVVAAIYLFGIFPAIHDFPLLVLALAPVFLPLGALLHRPGSVLIALPLVVNLSALLGLQNGYDADLQRFVNASVAMVLGIGLAVVLTRLFRSVGAEWSARRLVRQGWRTLAAAAAGHGSLDRAQFAARMLDLLGLLAPRLAATPPASALASLDMLGEVRVGLNILQLRRARQGLPPASVSAVDAILDAVAAHYRQQSAAKRALPTPIALRAQLDASLARVGQVPAGRHRDDALLGLIGLRHSLCTAQDAAPAAETLQLSTPSGAA
ncbi:FUSC family protein [Xanthomonas maliensis]|uniref:FUSC family protein n=1 Tax=Xanthomonas maliensis TaxID=1321368 RepID=UPI0003A7EF35|nr:FUSC family protein [Xanthomonas maliensis]KAB7768804.1 FUSC family protein [Xanthomonas maliensis]